MDISQSAQQLHKKFLSMKGSEYIATPVSIQAILDIVQKKKPKRVLEMGAGIGTLSYTILATSKEVEVDLYEDNEFCQTALKNNLEDFSGRFTLIPDYKTLPPHKEYDLFLVDGGNGKSHDGGSLNVVQKFVQQLTAKPMVCYVEGNRFSQRTLLRRALSDRFVYRQIQFYATYLNGEHYKGGVAIYCKPSNNWFLRTCNFWYWEVREWEPIKRAFAYRVQSVLRVFRK